MYRFPVLSLRRSKSALFALPSVAGDLTLILYQPLFSSCMVSWALFGLSLTLNLSGKSMVTFLLLVSLYSNTSLFSLLMMEREWLKSFLLFPLSYPARNPLFWLLLSPGIVFLGAVAGGGQFPVELFFVLVAVSYPSAFIMFALNDVYDGETDANNDRDLVKDNVVDADEDFWIVWSWAAIFFVLALVPVLWFGKVTTIVLGLGLLSSAVAYSVPPIRSKERPLGSVVLMAVGGWMLYALGYSFTGDLASIPPRSFFYGLLSHMGVSLGALPDMDADRAAGIETFPLRYGKTPTIGLALLSVLVTLLSGTVGGPVFWYLVVLGVGLVSMWLFERYILHFKVLLAVGFVFLVVLLYRGVVPLV